MSEPSKTGDRAGEPTTLKALIGKAAEGYLGAAKGGDVTLPYDIARCDGRISNRHLGQIASVRVTSNAGHSECVLCRRREPGAPDRPTPDILPPQFVGGKCPERISP